MVIIALVTVITITLVILLINRDRYSSSGNIVEQSTQQIHKRNRK